MYEWASAGGGGGGALTAISAAKAGIPSVTAIARPTTIFFMRALENASIITGVHPSSSYRCATANGKILKFSRHRDVRFGSKAEVTPLDCDVRFTPQSGH
jgi:hypothetical protein